MQEQHKSLTNQIITKIILIIIFHKTEKNIKRFKKSHFLKLDNPNVALMEEMIDKHVHTTARLGC